MYSNQKSNFWSDKNVLVTGCYGFLASWLIIELVKNGAKVIGLTNDYNPYSLLIMEGYEKKICLVYGSVTDYHFLERIFNQYEIQFCFHLAAQTIETVCTHSPTVTFETNIKGTWTILEVARNCKTLQAIIVASSDKAYGKQKKLPYREEHLLLGCYPYDVSKVCTELLSQSYFHTYNLPVGITRCANLYGGGDFHWSRIIPGTIRSILGNEAPVIRSDGTPVRDYLFVEDAVDAYLNLAEKVAIGEFKGEAFNFSGENPISVKDLVHLIISLMHIPHLKPKILGQKLSAEIDEQILSADKAKKYLNWKAKHSLKEGLKKTINWHKQHL